MVDTVRTQAELLAFLHPNIGNPMPDATVLVSQAARDLIVSIFPFFPNGLDPNGTIMPSLPANQGVTHGDLMQVYEGSPTHPVVTKGFTSVISKYMSGVDGIGDDNGVLLVGGRNSGTKQMNVIMAFAEVTGDKDSVGIYTTGLHSGAGVMYGAFHNVGNVNPAGGGVGIQVNVINGTGGNFAYNTNFNPWAGYDVYSAGPNNAQVGLQVRAGLGGQFRVGVGVLVGGATDSSFRTDSDTVDVLTVHGAHTNGIDFSAGSYSFAPIKFSSSYAIGYTGTDPLFIYDTAGGNDFFTYTRATNTFAFEVNGASVFSFTAGTLVHNALPTIDPGAGSKQFWCDTTAGNVVKYRP